MQRFLFIIRDDLSKLQNMTDQERYSRCVEEQLAWVRSLADAGLHLQGEPLAIKGRLVGKDQVIADGPFIEAKEGIAGFDIILAEDLDHAAEIAMTCPLVKNGVSIIEVRPIDGISQLIEASEQQQK